MHDYLTTVRLENSHFGDKEAEGMYLYKVMQLPYVGPDLSPSETVHLSIRPCRYSPLFLSLIIPRCLHLCPSLALRKYWCAYTNLP